MHARARFAKERGFALTPAVSDDSRGISRGKLRQHAEMLFTRAQAAKVACTIYIYLLFLLQDASANNLFALGELCLWDLYIVIRHCVYGIFFSWGKVIVRNKNEYPIRKFRKDKYRNKVLLTCQAERKKERESDLTDAVKISPRDFTTAIYREYVRASASSNTVTFCISHNTAHKRGGKQKNGFYSLSRDACFFFLPSQCLYATIFFALFRRDRERRMRDKRFFFFKADAFYNVYSGFTSVLSSEITVA